MFDRTAFKKVFDESGLTKPELAYLYGVSRQTLYGWAGGSVPKQHTLVERAASYTTALTAAMRQRLLPFPIATTPEVRKARLLKMAQGLHTLTAPR